MGDFSPFYDFLTIPAKGIVLHHRTMATDVLRQTAVKTAVHS